jgi:hypothetical protein
MIGTLLLLFAFVFATIAAVFITRVERPPVAVHFGWLAVAFYLLSVVLGAHGIR